MAPKSDEGIPLERVQAYLKKKVDEWADSGAAWEHEPYDSMAAAEQAFKEWLWGTSHG